MRIFLSLVPTCNNIADVAFIVDSSGSLRRHFSKEKQFVRALADVVGIASDGSKASVVTFSYNAEHRIKLAEHTDVKSFKDAVNNLPLMGYTTRIDKALEIVRDESFLPINGGRSLVPKVLFVLTDGTQTKDKDAKNPSGVAAQIRQKYGATIIAIGIGRRVNRAELTGIANGESKVYLAKNFAELRSSEFVSKIARDYCEGTT